MAILGRMPNISKQSQLPTQTVQTTRPRFRQPDGRPRHTDKQCRQYDRTIGYPVEVSKHPESHTDNLKDSSDSETHGLDNQAYTLDNQTDSLYILNAQSG